MLVSPFSVMVLFLKPTDEISMMAAEELRLMEKVPLSAVDVPCFVDFTSTEAPDTGLPDASFTVPFKVNVCENESGGRIREKAANNIHKRMIRFISVCLIFNAIKMMQVVRRRKTNITKSDEEKYRSNLFLKINVFIGFQKLIFGQMLGKLLVRLYSLKFRVQGFKVIDGLNL